MARASIAVLLSLAPALALADASLALPAATCRDSRLERRWSKAVYHNAEDDDRYGTSAWISTLSVKRDLDGDGKLDSLEGERAESYRWSSREVTLRLGDRTFKAFVLINFHGMAAYTSVPAPLVADARARHLVEEVLFARVCDTPDPAFARLLSPSAPLAWRDGARVLPSSYAVYSTRATDRARVTPDDEDRALEGEPPTGDTGGVWMSFDGDELWSRFGELGTGRPRLRVVTSGARHLELLPHAVELVEHGRRTWLYVAPDGNRRLADGAGGQLPRAAAIESARFAVSRVIVERSDGDTEDIDLTSGATTEREARPREE